jgi:neutral ceramidase
MACTPELPAAVTLPVTPYPSSPPHAFRAAASRVDVTPPPGVATFGHGPDALVSEGFWTRIECRAFALEQGLTRMVIVPCDLAASSTILQREVAARLVGVVPTTRIFMTATHTHAGPAHYMDEMAFGGPESTHAPGFDPHVVEFLADRIAGAVRRAFEHLVDADVRTAHFGGRPDECRERDCGEQGMWGITWNRSLLAHRAGGADPPAPSGLEGVDAAIDPSIHWVELRERGSQRAIGGLAFYAMHPTVLPNTNRLIGGDVDAIVSRLLEVDLCREQAGTLGDAPVGIVNTNEGDMSPVWTEGTKQEAIAVARRIEGRILAVRSNASDWKPEVTLDARYLELNLPGELTSDGSSTCSRSELGESVGFGACDHPTTDPDSPLPMHPWGACQHPKRTPLGELERIVAGWGAAFPSHVPVGLVRIDDSFIGFVPAETTIHTGALLRSAILAEIPKPVPGPPMYAFVGGLSNGYILYVTTEREYRWQGLRGGCRLPGDERVRQSYEGASNLYGPHTAQYLADALASLARAMNGASVPHVDQALPAPYARGPERSRLALPECAAHPIERKALTTCTIPGSRAVCFRWTDVPVASVRLVDAPWVTLRTADGSPVAGALGSIDDRGFDFVTRVGYADETRSEWSTLFAMDDAELPAMGTDTPVTIHVHGCPGSEDVRSLAFSRANMPPACGHDDVVACGDYNDPVGAKPYLRGWNGEQP